jgi:hypothetical protein
LRSPRDDTLRAWLSFIEEEISVSQALVAETVKMEIVEGGDASSSPPEPSSPTPGSPAERLGCLEMLVKQIEDAVLALDGNTADGIEEHDSASDAPTLSEVSCGETEDHDS